MQEIPLVTTDNDISIKVWRRLPQITCLAFTATPGERSLTGWSGTGHARVVCRKERANLRYFEYGVFTPAGSDRGVSFSNVYCWRLRGNALSLSHERFGRDHPVHLFDLAADGRGQLSSTSPHLCGADRYHGRLMLTDTGFILDWRIRGPAKNELLVYRYATDASDGAVDPVQVNDPPS